MFESSGKIRISGICRWGAVSGYWDANVELVSGNT